MFIRRVASSSMKHPNKPQPTTICSKTKQDKHFKTEGAQEKGKNLHSHSYPQRERERTHTHTHRHPQNTATCYYLPPSCSPSFNFFLLKAEAPPLRAHVAHSVTPRAFYDHWPASVLSNLSVGWSSFVLRESRAESNRVDLGLAEMGRKAGVIALFDVDGTLTPARKVVAFYATFLCSGFGVVGFPF
jgi:hypothetical protein